MDQSDVIPQLDCWEARAKKHDFRVLMAGEDSETSRHRADELRRCAAELRKLAGIPEPEKPATETKPAPVETKPAPVETEAVGHA